MVALAERDIIDVFTHVYPEEYVAALQDHPMLKERILGGAGRPAASDLVDMERRINEMDRDGIHIEVIMLNRPTLDDSGCGSDALSKVTVVANNGIARVVEKYPGRFLGVGTVSLRNVGHAIDELNRCVEELGLLGVQVLTNVDGRPLDSPELEPFYERLCHHDAALWIHPTDLRKAYDWLSEYGLMPILGWPMDSAFAMFRMVRGGVLERHPKLKVITHHMGTLIPFFARRIERSVMRQGKDGAPPSPLKKNPIEYLKRFYVDTSGGAAMPPLVCSQLFFGSGHMLFASDHPTGYEDRKYIIGLVNDLNISDEEKRMILGGNAMKLLGI